MTDPSSPGFVPHEAPSRAAAGESPCIRHECWAKVRDLLRGSSGVASLSPDAPMRVGLQHPSRIVLPILAEVGPVRIVFQNQLQLLLAAPTFYLDLAHSGANRAGMMLIPDQRIELVARSETIGIQLFLMLYHPADDIRGEAGIQPSRLVRHDVNPKAFHAPEIVSCLKGSGADSSASRN